MDGRCVAQLGSAWSRQLTAALPVVILNSPAVTDQRKGGAYAQFGGEAGDIVGVILFAIGFLWEAIADIQKVGLAGDAVGLG